MAAMKTLELTHHDALDRVPVIARNTVAEAVRLAELGYRVLPTKPGMKRPVTRHGSKDASRDIEQIIRWWNWLPDANLAVETTGLCVIDIDDHDHRIDDHGPCPITMTPRGEHYWYRSPAGVTMPNTKGRIAGADCTRGRGGYVLVPPSMVDGVEYAWAPGRSLSVPPDQLPEAPASIAAMIA